MDEFFVVTGRAEAAACNKITQQAILKFHDSRISVKLGTAEEIPPTDVPNFTLIGGYLRISGPKKNEKLLKLPTLSPHRGKPLAGCYKISMQLLCFV